MGFIPVATTIDVCFLSYGYFFCFRSMALHYDMELSSYFSISHPLCFAFVRNTHPIIMVSIEFCSHHSSANHPYVDQLLFSQLDYIVNTVFFLDQMLNSINKLNKNWMTALLFKLKLIQPNDK